MFEFWTTIVRVAMPLAYLLGASFAYHLYLDYAEERHIQTTWIAKYMPDLFMHLKRRVDRAGERYGNRLPLAGAPPQTQVHTGGGFNSGGNERATQSYGGM